MAATTARRFAGAARTTAMIAAFLLAWEAVVHVFAIKPYILPPPSAIFAEIWTRQARYLCRRITRCGRCCWASSRRW